MKNNIRDYLHLYPNAKYRVRYVDYEKDTWTVWLNLTLFRLNQILSDSSVEDIQIALRPLSDMSEDEFKNLLPEFSMDIFNSYHSYIEWKDKPKHVLILENRVQTNTLRFNDGIVLLREKYDLFGLIESGSAIDATTLKKLETDIAK